VAVALAVAGPAGSAPRFGAHTDPEAGDVVRHALVVARGAASRADDAADAPHECRDGAYEFDAGTFRLEETFTYSFIASSTPPNLNVENTEAAVQASIGNWAQVRNACGFADDVLIRSEYAGRSFGWVEITDDGDCKDSSDGRSETGFGPLPSDLVAVACIWLGDAPGPPYPVASADVRLNRTLGWSNQADECTGRRYLVEAALTHERGHVLGLSHHKRLTEAAHGNLTMSPNLNGFCNDAETTLGRGDVLGLRARGYAMPVTARRRPAS